MSHSNKKLSFTAGTKLLIPPPVSKTTNQGKKEVRRLDEWQMAEIISPEDDEVYLRNHEQEQVLVKLEVSGNTRTIPKRELEYMMKAYMYKNQTFCKAFGEDGVFNGKLVDVIFEGQNDILFYVEYEDEDSEDLHEWELVEGIKLFQTLQKKKKVEKVESSSRQSKRRRRPQTKKTVKGDDTPPPRHSKRQRRSLPSISYIEDSDGAFEEEESMEENEEEKVQLARKKSPKGPLYPIFCTKKAPKEGDYLAYTSKDSEEDEEMISDSYSEEEDELPTKKTKSKPKPKKATSKKKSMKDSFEPINRPLYPTLSLAQIKRTKQFLDPCGQEATDDIISRLVGEQVDKLAPLLQRALDANSHLGSKFMPLKLGTACSGTDAPALALTLIQEQLELRNLTTLHYEHKFSCEVEPFKQAYLARNFDSVLYPDICLLGGENPRDAYGQAQPIPDYNIFVAGTSCKNFSMLRANKRLDIEDKGCSGETFLAAVEHIFEKKPPFCVLENVQNAPWDKMSEYIEGKIFLGNASSKKAITGGKKDETLQFISLDKKVIVDKVPSVFGVRCGSCVLGFTKAGDDEEVIPVRWPFKKKDKCTLEELTQFNQCSMEDDTLVFEVPIRYHTCKIKVDTKNFGLPQTRNRMYLFVFPVVEGKDLGEYFKLLVEHLKSPVRHSLEAFVLQEDHDIIRVFREALRGPAGRHTKRGIFLESDFWTSTSANLPHNKNSRAALGVEDMARPITDWGPFGKKQIPPHYWLEFLNCCNQRKLDLLDILHASSVRDAEGHDSSFASFVWNISQNATREKHRSACPGISGCVTPGGEFFLPHFGRPLLGCEKLLLQGIPYFRLALGTETEVQLGDLAGNAMSLTVVGATLLAAICCKQLRQEAQDTSTSSKKKTDPLQCAQDILDETSIQREPDLATNPSLSLGQNPLKDGLEFVQSLSNLAEEAIRTSIWCTCETSGQISLSNVFFQCRICKISCCQECCSSTAGYQLKSHVLNETKISKQDRKLGTFDSKLRNIVPPTIVFPSLDTECSKEKNCHSVSSLANLGFNLHRISRLKRAWQILYFCRERQVGEALAELAIRVGELADGSLGACVELRSFLPARVVPLKYGPLTPIAVWQCPSNTTTEKQEWFCAKASLHTKTLKVVGSSPGPSFRTEVGLMSAAADAVNSGCKKANNRKSFAQAKQLREERRWLYPKNWKKWPNQIEVYGSDQAQVAGTYVRAHCRQTVNQNAVWIRKDRQPTLYILIRPQVSRTGPDFAILSKSISYQDASSVIATLPESWEPSDALLKESHTVNGVQFHEWIPRQNIKCMVPTSNISVSSPSSESDDDSNELLTVHGLSEVDCDMLSLHAPPVSTEGNVVPLLMANGQKAQQTVRAFNAVCVSKILQHAASHGVHGFNLKPEAKWISIASSDSNVPFGDCSRTFPLRPKELWRKDVERHMWERIYEPGESRAFYQALEKRPRAFEFHLDRTVGALKVNLNPNVVAHYAAGHLKRGRGLLSSSNTDSGDDIRVSVKLVASQFQSDPILDAFCVPGCHDEVPTQVQLKVPYQLYERQQKVVTKMRAIENRETIFEEIEMYEEHMPGSTGWSLIAKAQRDAKISGGVIADAIGAGKTVISIALILQGIKESRSKSNKDPRQSKATLVVVPSHLIRQWKSEFEKFTDGLTVFPIYDLTSLLKLSVKDVTGCDCIILPVDILESKDYLQHVLEMGGSSSKDCPNMPRYVGQKEMAGASGVWVPATSADPYGGSNNGMNQQRRNASARYTHVYLNAVHNLRQRKFGKSKKGIPLEYFEWERIIVDEIHESLCCTKEEVDASNNLKKEGEIFKEKNRRAGRELLGIMTRDPSQRPLVARKAIFGLTGTPLLDSSSRVIELANLIGCTYVLGLSSHWRKLERESCRDIFLHYYLEPKQSRLIRRNLYSKCQDYISTACCRNKVGDEMKGIKLEHYTRTAQMNKAESALYLKSQSGIPAQKQSFSITPEDFDVSAGHDITKFLRQNIDLDCRKQKLVEICRDILQNDETTKIIVFADGRVGGGISAREALRTKEGLGCTWLDEEDSTEVRNHKIAWYQHGDATEEDKSRPRILVLHFEHAAGLNLQAECYNVIFFSPLYVGNGGAQSDAVADVSTELQATGRVFRPGQTHPVVNLFRIEVRGPNDEDCLDKYLMRRNTDQETIDMAVNSSD